MLGEALDMFAQNWLQVNSTFNVYGEQYNVLHYRQTHYVLEGIGT